MTTTTHPLLARIARSTAATDTPTAPLAALHQWWQEVREADDSRVELIPFEAMRSWSFAPGTGNLVHDTGRFFSVEGLRVHRPEGPVPHWSQPILNQPEVGVLGILAKEFGGVLHFLMQAKMEPGNCNGLQLSPTVQATLSNYTRVHKGGSVPYIDHFLSRDRHRVLVDVRQSEQGSWFHRKRNRNMVVEVTEDVEVRPGFRWVTLGQLHRLLAVDDLVNMDARSILACLPFPFEGVTGEGRREPGTELLSWLTEARSMERVLAERVPLAGLPGWRRRPDRISHEDGAFFDIVAVDVTTGGREVGGWTQPLLRPRGQGVSAFVTKRVGGVRHVLASVRVEAGCADVLELGPTVQYTPENYARLPAGALPPLLDEVLGAPAERVLFDTVLSEEGGRLHHARSRYLIVEEDANVGDGADGGHRGDGGPPGSPGHRWIPMDELVGLMQHSHYVNVEARTLVACLQSVCGPAERRPARSHGKGA
ncbi:NDP-hexose 2,3-dehydratase family protein [Streptomyces sp. GS7]|uniref:NDP-hexose 2,3-dehydratase family protein n=1 Tax=Streptomyces sp. GS7 TaxID=2692234 RepID=UPI001F20D690|nr:NDP-hexose 2,3-dehydratase family protein [Streptomyces sp. GS7]